MIGNQDVGYLWFPRCIKN